MGLQVCLRLQRSDGVDGPAAFWALRDVGSTLTRVDEEKEQYTHHEDTTEYEEEAG